MWQKIDRRPEMSVQPRPAHEVILISLALVPVALALALAGALMLVYADELSSQFARKLVSTIGSFLLVGGTFGFIWRALYRRAIQERQNERIMALFRAELSRLVPNVVLFGLSNIEDRMNYGGLFKSLQKGDELWWLDTYAPGYEDWRAEFTGAIRRGAKIKMLVLEPGCNTATFRAKEIASEIPPATFHSGLKQFHDHMVARASESATAVEVRTYSNLLGCPIYLIERNRRVIKAFSSLYLNPASFDFPHFVWEDSKSPQFLIALEKYVKDKWNDKDSKLAVLKTT